MKALFSTLLLFLTFSYAGSAQNVNLIIQVNEKLIYGEISGLYLQVGTGNNSEKINVSYVPGDLILNEHTWNIINSDTSKKISLHFTYNTFSKSKHETASFYVDLTRYNLKMPYLILNIYDFRDKKYRHWYQYLTDKDFLAELRFTNSGIFIRKT
jgi:hypothetical protein